MFANSAPVSAPTLCENHTILARLDGFLANIAFSLLQLHDSERRVVAGNQCSKF